MHEPCELESGRKTPLRLDLPLAKALQGDQTVIFRCKSWEGKLAVSLHDLALTSGERP